MAVRTDQEIADARRKATQSPTAWFAVLESARRKGDIALSHRALAELERLGVKVQFDQPREAVR